MAKKEKTNSGSDFNTNELGGELPNENVNATETQETTTEEKPATPKKRKKEVVVSGAEFWRFAPETDGGDFDGHEFFGYFRGEVKREKDGKGEDQKAGSVIGYNFEQEGTGLMFIVGNSHAIEKALSKKSFSTELLWCIEFLGKGITADKKPYNRFECSVITE
jgi:hypothetical protein